MWREGLTPCKCKGKLRRSQDVGRKINCQRRSFDDGGKEEKDGGRKEETTTGEADDGQGEVVDHEDGEVGVMGDLE
jgi:hypothetical protein